MFITGGFCLRGQRPHTDLRFEPLPAYCKISPLTRSAATEERGSVELEQVQVQRQALAPQITQHELEFQEQLIAERESEIREIESGIHELNDIFRDLGAIIQSQGGLIGELGLEGRELQCGGYGGALSRLTLAT